MAKYFSIPFAMNGDRKEIPTDKQEDGSISFNEGYGADYEKNKQVDPAAKDISRQDFNGVLHDITEAIGDIQRSGIATWTNEISYNKGATIIHNGAVYTSTINANKNEPPHTSWSSLDLSEYRKKDDLLFKGMMQVQATDDVGTGVFFLDKAGNPRAQITSNSAGLQFAKYDEDGTSRTYTLAETEGMLLTDGGGKWAMPELAGSLGLGDVTSLEYYGVDSNSSPEFNAQVFKDILMRYGKLSNPKGTYTFKFDKDPITLPNNITEAYINITTKQNFLDFGGIVADSVEVFKGSFNIDAKGTYCKGFIKLRKVRCFSIHTLHIVNVLVDTLSGDSPFWGVEYGSNLFGDNNITGIFSSIYIKNVITKSGTVASGLAKPATIFGTTGSSSGRYSVYQIHCSKAYIEDFYSVDSNSNLVDGDSDAFRLFTSKLNISFGNIVAINVGKRLVKTQAEGSVSIESLYVSLDDRFDLTTTNGILDAQTTYSSKGTSFNVGSMIVESHNMVIACNSSGGVEHSFSISKAVFSSLRAYSTNDTPTKHSFKNLDVVGKAFIQNTLGEVTLHNFKINEVEVIWSGNTYLNQGSISSFTDRSSGTNITNLNGAYLSLSCNVGQNISVVKYLEKSIIYSFGEGDANKPPLLLPNNTIGDSAFISLEHVALRGTSLPNYLLGGGSASGSVSLSYINTSGKSLMTANVGNWLLRLNFCSTDVVVGSGIKEVKKVVYS